MVMDSAIALVSLLVATMAVALTVITLLLQRRQQQREAYRGIYEALMSDQLQRGRWAISDIPRSEQLPEAGSADHYVIFRTLGWFDTLAMYYRHKLIPRQWVLDVWHHALHDMRPGAKLLLSDHLEENQDYAPWPYLWSLLDDAADYRSSMPCCHPQDLTAASPAHSKPQAPG
jgi:hypothetical protein